MFAKFDDAVVPTEAGLDSLVPAGVCSPLGVASMRAQVALQDRLGDHYRVYDQTAGTDYPWLTVMARWDGEPIDGDVSAEIKEAVAPLAVHYAGFGSGRNGEGVGLFCWMVQVPTADTWAEPPVANSTGFTPVASGPGYDKPPAVETDPT